MLALVLSAALLAQVPTQPTTKTPPDQKCVVAGRIVNSQTGEPLKKATVHLKSVFSRARNSDTSYIATSDGEGNFRIEGIEPGNYNLSGERTGFLLTQYGATQPTRMGTRLTLTPGQQITDINLALFPQAVISGKVVDEEGDPLDGIEIQALRQTRERGKLQYLAQAGAETNDLGEFRVANLAPGKYCVCALQTNSRRIKTEQAQPGKPDISPAPTCYPDAATIANAAPIEIATGQDVPSINIRMRNAPTFHIRGKVAEALSTNEAGRIGLSLIQNDDASFDSRQATVAKDRTFDIAGVAPGSYTVAAFTTNRGISSVGRQPVEVGQADVNDVVVTLVPPGSMHGSIHLEGTPSGNVILASVRVSLVPAGEPRPYLNTQAKADGTFSLENVSPEKYDVMVIPPNRVYVRSIRFGDQEILGKELDLSQGVSGNLDITLRYGPAEVDGTVQAENSSSQSGFASDVTVVLVPEALNEDGSGIEFSHVDRSGSFFIRHIAPGRYRACALEQIDTSQLENPELLKELQTLGTEVELNENDRKQIQPTLIPTGEIQQIFTRLGIDASQ